MPKVASIDAAIETELSDKEEEEEEDEEMEDRKRAIEEAQEEGETEKTDSKSNYTILMSDDEEDALVRKWCVYGNLSLGIHLNPKKNSLRISSIPSLILTLSHIAHQTCV